MALVRRDRFGFDFPGQMWQERWRRLFDPDFESGWMRIEEFHDGDTLVVRAELPDLDPERDVEVTVSDRMLHIEAHREERSERKEKGSYRSEFHYGQLSRSMPLPQGVNAEDVKASYTNGVLEIRVPMPSEEKTAVTKVPISGK
jgi:HSP20 family protein